MPLRRGEGRGPRRLRRRTRSPGRTEGRPRPYAAGINEGNFLTSFQWNANANPPDFGIAVLVYGT
ncbi:hypothetical protein AB0L08_28195, partial [Streptomyces albidoflavus]